MCSGDFTCPCSIHAIFNHFEILRSSHRGEVSSPLSPTISGGFLDKWRVMTSNEFVARLIGEALMGLMVYGDSEVTVFALPVHGWWLVWVLVSCSSSWQGGHLRRFRVMSLRSFTSNIRRLPEWIVPISFGYICSGDAGAARGCQVRNGAGQEAHSLFAAGGRKAQGH